MNLPEASRYLKNQNVLSDEWIDHLLPVFFLNKPLSLVSITTLSDASLPRLDACVREHFTANKDYFSNGGDLWVYKECLKSLAILTKSQRLRKSLESVENGLQDFLKQSLTSERLKREKLEAKVNNKYEPGERVYILKNDMYEETDSVFKIGRTSNMNKRLQTYNTSNLHGILVLYERPCINSKVVEAVVHHILDEYRVDQNREYFKAPLSVLKKVLDDTVAHCDGMRRKVAVDPDSIFKTERKRSREPSPVDESRWIPEPVKDKRCESPYFIEKIYPDLSQFRYVPK
jgi:hypothetical protein